jgi:hypothetical protein
MMDRINLLGIAGSQTDGSALLVDGGLYVWENVCATWNSATVTLEALAADGSTYYSVAGPIGANGATGPVAVGGPTRLRANITGSPSAVIYSTLTRYQGAP